jgi:hypothetical protein
VTNQTANPVFCPNGHPVRPSARFCRTCGAAIGLPREDAATSERDGAGASEGASGIAPLTARQLLVRGWRLPLLLGVLAVLVGGTLYGRDRLMQHSSGISATSVAHDEAASYAGDWINDQSGGIDRMIITASGDTISIHPFSACAPSDCDWGTESTRVADEPIRLRFESGAQGQAQDLSITFSDPSRTQLRVHRQAGDGGETYTFHRAPPSPPHSASPPRSPTELAGTATVRATKTAPHSTDGSGRQVSYPASNVLDGDPTTAWRAPGDGSGVALTFTFPAAVNLTAVGLMPGYNKIDPATGVHRWSQNRRLTFVRWLFDDGTMVTQNFTDTPSMQEVSVNSTTSTVVLQIVSTKSGDPHHDYTAVSDVSLMGD